MTRSTRTATATATAILVVTSSCFQTSVAFAPPTVGPLAPGASRPLASSSSSSSALSMSKESADRARVEKNLEELMDNDWRAFRAKLVLQEMKEAENKKGGKGAGGEGLGGLDRNLHEQDKLGNLFVGMLASVFSEGKDDDTDGEVKFGDFDWDDASDTISTSVLPQGCSDPFASPEEIPALLSAKECVKLDKHRWAHPIPHVEPGCVLVANERLGGVFHQTVVLVIDHNEATGSTGIVINRPMSGNLFKVSTENPSNIDLSIKVAFSTATVSYGGPIQKEEYSVLHGYGEVEGSKKVAPGVFVGGSEELSNEVHRENFSPDQALFVKGHTSWVPGQLSREVAKGVWYTASVSADFILRYAGAQVTEDDNLNDLWSDIMSCMGGKYREIMRKHAGKGDMRMKS